MRGAVTFPEQINNRGGERKVCLMHKMSKNFFTITAEIHARSLANFYCQYADRHMSLKFMRRVSERELAIQQFVIVKNKLMSVFNMRLSCY